MNLERQATGTAAAIPTAADAARPNVRSGDEGGLAAEAGAGRADAGARLQVVEVFVVVVGLGCDSAVLVADALLADEEAALAAGWLWHGAHCGRGGGGGIG